MRNRRNYYRILHVQPDAPPEIVRSSFRALMLQLEMHPDRGGEHWNAALINAAYSTLGDPDKREAYDRKLSESGTNAFTGPAHRGRDRGTGRPGADRAGDTAAERCVFCQTPCGAADARGEGRCPDCGSPLAPASRLELPGSAARSANRVSQTRSVHFYTDWPQDQAHRGVLRDISPRGLRFRTGIRLRRYQIVKIDGGALQAVGRVARCSRDGAGSSPFTVGVEFFTVQMNPGAFLSARA